MSRDLRKEQTEKKRIIQVYSTENEQKRQEVLKLREEVNALKRSNEKLIESVEAETEKRVSEYKELILREKEKLEEELTNYMEKYKKHKEKKKHFKGKLQQMTLERDKINEAFYSNNKIHEEQMDNMKKEYEKEISDLKKREAKYLEENAKVLESDVYKIYKLTKGKYESKLKECVEIKDERDAETKEKNNYKHEFENNDRLLNDCIRIQAKQQMLIKEYEQRLEEQANALGTVNL